MQTCGVCNTRSADGVKVCPKCKSDLSRESMTARALAKIRANPRARFVQIAVYDDCCPACLEVYGSYPKEQVPTLPVDGCSHPLGCRCFYMPALSEIFP